VHLGTDDVEVTVEIDVARLDRVDVARRRVDRMLDPRPAERVGRGVPGDATWALRRREHDVVPAVAVDVGDGRSHIGGPV
jgi:hypothetical protein